MILYELSAQISHQKLYAANIRPLNLCSVGFCAQRLIFLSLYLHPASLKKLLQGGISCMTCFRVTLWRQLSPKLFPSPISGTLLSQPACCQGHLPASGAAATSSPWFARRGSNPLWEHRTQSQGGTSKVPLDLEPLWWGHWRTQLPRYSN